MDIPGTIPSEVVITTHPDRESWLRAREGRMNASEVAVLFDVSPYDSPHSLFLKKRGLRDDYDPAWIERMEIARAMEPVVAGIFERKTGLSTMDLGEYAIATHAAYPALGATLDRVVLCQGQAVPLEIKAPGSYKARDWDEEVPLEFQIQATVQMMCIGAQFGFVAAIIGGAEFRYQRIERNPDLCAIIASRAAEFMDAVQRGEAPPVDGSDHTTRALKALHPSDNGERVPLPLEAVDWHHEMEAVKAQIKALESKRDLLQNQFRAALGPATFGFAPGLEVSLKTQGDKPSKIEVPLEHASALAAASIPHEIKRSPEFRVLRMKQTKAA